MHGWWFRGLWAILAAVLALAVALACGGAVSPAPVPDDPDQRVWERLDRDRDGALTTTGALQAVGLGFGVAVPGVTLPGPADGSVPPCATEIAFAVGNHRAKFTAAQRAAVDAVFPTITAKTATQAEAQRMVDEEIAAVARLTGATRPTRVIAELKSAGNVGATDGGTTAAFAQLEGAGAAPAATATCRIVIARPFFEEGGVPARNIVAHEVTHCFQYVAFPGTIQQFYAYYPPHAWIIEGGASWVAQRLHRWVAWGSPQLNGYVGGSRTGGLSVTTNSYASYGFFEEVARHTDPSRVVVALSGLDHIPALQLLTGGRQPWYADVASGPGRWPERGAHWQWASLPDVAPDAHRSPFAAGALVLDGPSVTRAGYSTRGGTALPALQSNTTWTVPVGAEVIEVSTDGWGRAWLAADLGLSPEAPQRVFCTASNGCVCPNGRPLLPAGQLVRSTWAKVLEVAVFSGDHVGVGATVRARTLAAACASPPAEGTCPQGNWEADTRELQGVMASQMPPGAVLESLTGQQLLKLSGSSGVGTANAVRARLSNSGVTSDFKLDGVATFTVAYGDGVMTWSKRSFEGSGTLGVEIGGRRTEMPAPPELSQWMAPAGKWEYRCEGGNLKLHYADWGGNWLTFRPAGAQAPAPLPRAPGPRRRR